MAVIIEETGRATMGNADLKEKASHQNKERGESKVDCGWLSGVSSFAWGMAPAGVGFGGVSTNCSVAVVVNRALQAFGSTPLDPLTWIDVDWAGVEPDWGAVVRRIGASSGTPLDAGEDAGTSRIRKPGPDANKLTNPGKG